MSRFAGTKIPRFCSKTDISTKKPGLMLRLNAAEDGHKPVKMQSEDKEVKQ